ncbi:MAG: ribonuclease P protein component [Gammaproteobacteria bacterium]|nr:ribonuclease P protein component [Gammaproteobacteria bacterium]
MPGEFKYVFDHSVRSSDQAMTVFAVPNHLPQARLGLTVGKKHLKLAVDRNRIKRLTRESFRRHQDELAGLDLIMMVRAGIKQLDNHAILTALDKHWQRVIKRCAQSSSN